MNRRMALRILALSLAAAATRVGAQQSGRIPVVGLIITHPPVDDLVVDYLRRGLQKHGYEDGKNVRLEVRTALGRLERVPALADELVRLPVDVVVVANERALRAVMQATTTIPIVTIGLINDPVDQGWIESYRRPGGNVTGVFAVDLSLGAKRLEILKETLPGIVRVAVLWNSAFGRLELDDIHGAARLLNLELVPIDVRSAQDLVPAIETVKQKKAGAVMLAWSPVFWVQRERLLALCRDASLPVFSHFAQVTRIGGLLSYGSDNVYNWGRAAYFIDRLLKGAIAAEIPVEQASTFKFVVNLKTAETLGITIPRSILLRADEVVIR
jgi:putative ABC transport system substrate-binding protein